ncbi:aminoglycoside phosphotransferase family protein [Nocardia sp. CDC159]|uniref:Aminoglycoside phosphotransferase family protein n=1 Tax=Nocardia pulmonis TaxID=2951408 RepID=A0A9X2J0R4_9NOCA|nr:MULTISPECIES: phosphotransferase [Nocardia]MCM6778838.1 aminoglycoside phosphotransferase family protein [Nocardia pulmonis]MCM6791727.1 aminoglycoside phosphotransferase family protein [Nocardia sp. CDC159]
MPEAMTTEQLADRTARAREAAVAAGRELGLTVTDATVLHDVFSVVVHLAPAPVVVRVPTVLPDYLDLEAQTARQRTELDVVAWLAGRGEPVIPPSPLVPREPVRRNGFSMTFWQFVELDDSTEPDYARNCGLVADLHAALRDYPGELPYLSAAEPNMVEDGLTALRERPDLLAPDDLDRARREWDALAPIVASRAAFEAAFPGIDLQPIHGDAPAANIVDTRTGTRYSDFELVTLGPPEWDLAFFGPEHLAAYNSTARERGLRELDSGVMDFVNAVGMARTVACLALVPRLPVLADSLKPALELWRSTPPFEGVRHG